MNGLHPLMNSFLQPSKQKWKEPNLGNSKKLDVDLVKEIDTV
jgi:hypothetical protein